ncbi:MAG: hypothetical protein ACE5J9_06125, partial [Methanosarcinales archaeon]
CPICEKGTLIEVDDILSEVEGYVFVEKGERCTQCGSEFIPECEGARMIKIARKLGIWGGPPREPLKLYRKLSKSANGITLTIPEDLEKNLNLKGDEEVIISKFGSKKILIEVA